MGKRRCKRLTERNGDFATIKEGGRPFDRPFHRSLGLVFTAGKAKKKAPSASPLPMDEA
jgi:hypothetical protein